MDYGEVRNRFLNCTQEEFLGMIPCGISCAQYRERKENGPENIQIIYANDEFYRCIGYKKEEFEATGQDMGAIMVKSDRQAARNQMLEAFRREGHLIIQKYRIHRPDDGVNHVLCSMKSFHGFGDYHFLLGIYVKIDSVMEEEQVWMEQQARMEQITSRLSRMLQELPSGCAVVQGGDSWELVSGNEEFFKPGGYTLNEIQSMPNDVYDIIYPMDVHKLKRAAEEALSSESAKECEIRIYDKQKKICYLAVKIRFYYYQNGKPYYLISIWNIHERKLMEEELHLQTERYRLMEEINNEFPFEYNVKNATLLIPKKLGIFLRMEGRKDYNACREELGFLIHPQDAEEFWGMIDRASAEEVEGSIEYRMNIAKVGEEPEFAWYRTSYRSILGVGGKIVRIMGRTEDINGQKLKQDAMAQQIRQDALTGLLNKAAVKMEIQEFIQDGQEGSHALFLIDIDNFKTVNDTFGHLFGDSVLVNISEKIKGLFRSSDIVGRIGGDEFIAFMKHTSESQARVKAQSICDVVKQNYNGMEEQIEISCSVGVALCGRVREEYNTLFSKADMAMYKAKEAGKNQYYVAEYANPAWVIHKSTGIESRTGVYKAGKSQDSDFLTKAFNLLSHAKDINNSLNLLVERIGRQYDLGMVAVLEHNKNLNKIFQTNCWSRKRGILERQSFASNLDEWDVFLNGMDKKGIVCLNDCITGAGMTDREREIFRRRDVYAMVNCSFSYFEWGEGYVVFCNMEKPRIWTDYEKETFLELTRLLSVFVALRVQQEEEKKTIRHLRKRDPLTGLYNEEAFRAKLEKKMQDWRQDLQYAIVYTDINDFSYINDNFGHDVGNEILKRFADYIQSDDNIISCRLYSDLFISFMWDRDKDTILQKIEKKSMNFSRQQKKRYTAANVKMSAGIYFIEQKNENLEIAIENANLARKSIKGEGGGILCRVYEKKLRQKREREKMLVAEFQKTLEENRIEVFIQPKFLLKEFQVSGGEALSRWRDRQGGLESPQNFIPALEKSGYIVNLDFYVYEQVLSYMKKWKEEGKELPVISINFSGRHFEGSGIYRKVLRLAENYGIETSKIEIEITENLFAIGYDQAKMEMIQLRKAGFKVAIDDFGTGYSSLSMLMDIPADIIKIDKSFLGRENCQKEKQFMRHMGELIHSLKEDVIFEGVETQEQRELLVECGFQYGQGFLFERPVPIQVFEEKYMK